MNRLKASPSATNARSKECVCLLAHTRTGGGAGLPRRLLLPGHDEPARPGRAAQERAARVLIPQPGRARGPCAGVWRGAAQRSVQHSAACACARLSHSCGLAYVYPKAAGGVMNGAQRLRPHANCTGLDGSVQGSAIRLCTHASRTAQRSTDVHRCNYTSVATTRVLLPHECCYLLVLVLLLVLLLLLLVLLAAASGDGGAAAGPGCCSCCCYCCC